MTVYPTSDYEMLSDSDRYELARQSKLNERERIKNEISYLKAKLKVKQLIKNDVSRRN